VLRWSRKVHQSHVVLRVKHKGRGEGTLEHRKTKKKSSPSVRGVQDLSLSKGMYSNVKSHMGRQGDQGVQKKKGKWLGLKKQGSYGQEQGDTQLRGPSRYGKGAKSGSAQGMT